MSEVPPILSRASLDAQETLSKLDHACRDWGLFYLVDHEVQEIEPLFSHMREFFLRPQSDKRQVQRTRENTWGYYDKELTKNKRDWKEIFDFGPAKGSMRAQWPTNAPDFRHLCERHFAACERISFELLAAVSKNMGVSERFLFRDFQPSHSSFMRLNFYPTCPNPDDTSRDHISAQGHLGINHHTDSGAITILTTNGTPGLEVYVRDQWRPVPPLDDALIVNIGDVVQVWSNDRYRAPLHRVRANDSEERMSIPFFFNPKHSCNYEPLPYDKADSPKYRAINWSEFRAKRADGDYADWGEEIQIDHYRI
ncbi:MAG: hypothetical protein CBC94_001495 [Gammaproteobacteria bacterium TMED134]|nr:MAG: hypothetical protein CBC94_001495 [Gammaproteobacteria bacterium TMED134]RZO69502.1 MAG: hypothetical protein EVA67_10740 [OM182 bacterium]|tara:strand:- start:422 stop:1351 length:930 start_codon:yes stop_codon:yes gene_type:complete